MPVNIQHSPSLVDIGSMSLASGAGQFRQYQDKLALQQNSQALQAAGLQLQAAGMAQRERMQNQAYAQQNRANWYREAWSRDRMNLGYMMQTERDDIEHERRVEMERARAEERKAAADTTYTRLSAQQKQEIARINNAMDWVSRQPSWSDGQKQQAMWQLQQRMAGVSTPRPMPAEDESSFPEGKGIGQLWEEGGRRFTRDENGIPKDLGAAAEFPVGMGEGQVWSDPTTGALMTRNKGVPSILMKPGDIGGSRPSFEDFSKMVSDMIAKSPMDDNGRPTLSAEAAAAKVQQIYQQYQQYFGEQAGGQSPQGPFPPQLGGNTQHSDAFYSALRMFDKLPVPKDASNAIRNVPVRVSTPDEVKKLPPGQAYQDPYGRVFYKK